MNETIALLILAVLSAGAARRHGKGAGSYGVETVLTGTIQCERSGQSLSPIARSFS